VTPRARRRGSARRGRAPSVGFWGDDGALDPVGAAAVARDPGALLRSLGPAPLHAPGVDLEPYLEVVVARAARVAGAILASADLVDGEAAP
jgi:hypothetical protein